MNGATIAQSLLTLFILLVFLGFFVWGIRTGQFRDMEKPTRDMLDDDDPSPHDPSGGNS